MRRLFCILFSLCMGSAMCAVEPPSGDSKPRLAILPLKEEGKNNLGDVSDTLNTLVANAFLEAQTFQLVERHQIQTLLDEAKFQHSGLTDENTIAEMGKHLGVKYVLVGSYLAEKSSYQLSLTLSLRLVDVSNATVYKSFMENAEGSTLGATLPKLSKALSEKVSELQIPGTPSGQAKKIGLALVVLVPGSITCVKKAQTHPDVVSLSFFNETLEDYSFLETQLGKLFSPSVKVIYETNYSSYQLHDLLEKHHPGALVQLIIGRTGKIHTFHPESEHRADVEVKFINPKTGAVIGIKHLSTDLIKGKLYEVFPLIKEELTKSLAKEVTSLPFEM
jgi:TolB-like protein